MAFNGNYAAGLSWEPNPVPLTTTGSTTIYEAVDDETILAAFGVANEDTTNATRVSVHWYNATNTTSYLIWIGEIAAGETEIVEGIPRRLRIGDQINATAAAANDLTVNPVLVRQGRFEQSR